MTEVKRAQSILVANNKGGVGKSTLSATLATALTMRNKKVLLIDADPQQSLSRWRQCGAGEAHENQLPWVERVDNALVGQKIQLERPNYDYIITDTGSGIGFAGDVVQKILLSAIKNADRILVPIGASPLDVDGSEDLFKLLSDIWERVDGRYPPAYVVINNVKLGTSLGREVAGYVTQVYDVPVLAAQVPQREVFKTSFFKGATALQSSDKKAPGEIRALVDEIIALEELEARNGKR